jgi:hypothetical protein
VCLVARDAIGAMPYVSLGRANSPAYNQGVQLPPARPLRAQMHNNSPFRMYRKHTKHMGLYTLHKVAYKHTRIYRIGL